MPIRTFLRRHIIRPSSETYRIILDQDWLDGTSASGNQLQSHFVAEKVADHRPERCCPCG
jgi:hypothetical protein